jgi:hypothetical protein
MAMKYTNLGFDFLEAGGISPRLRETYFSMPDEERWYERFNVVRKPDWVLTPEEALGFQLVTRILP